MNDKKRIFFELIMLTLATVVLDVGVYFFKFPNNFSFGGVTGVSVILSKLFSLSSATYNLIINMALLLLGFIFLSKGFGIKTVYISVLSSLLLSAMEHFIPMDGPLTDEPVLELIFAIVLLFWGLFFNQLHALSINESLARSKGYKVEVLDDIFAVLIAIVIMLSIQWVGSLIINALLIIPAAASRNIARNVREYHWFAILISLFSGITGLVFSYINNTATGPTIVLTLAVVFFLSLAVKPVLK